MCLASKYLNQLESLTKNLVEDKEKLQKKMSEYDKLVSDHYHKIETMNFNACEGFYLSKQLQEILRKRRVIKDEHARLHTLTQMLKISNSAVKKSKVSINKAKNKSARWQHNWKQVYDIEELIH